MNDLNIKTTAPGKRIGIAADHGGYVLKEYLLKMLRESGNEIIDFGNYELDRSDDYPDYIIPLSKALATGNITHGIAICGSGVGACILANKVAGVRACLITESFSAHQGVEDDNMNMICFGGKLIDESLAWELTSIFLNAEFSHAERHVRRLSKMEAMEKKINK